MKIKITLMGQAVCSTIIEGTEKDYNLLKKIESMMGDEENEQYSPTISVIIIDDDIQDRII